MLHDSQCHRFMTFLSPTKQMLGQPQLGYKQFFIILSSLSFNNHPNVRCHATQSDIPTTSYNESYTDSINIYITANNILLLLQGIGEVHLKYGHEINYPMFRRVRLLLFTHQEQNKFQKLQATP